MTLKCEHCGAEVEDEFQLDIEHRACRLKVAFPGAYTEGADGLVTFDMKRVAESLGLFNDIVIGRDGQELHPLEGDLHFRISAQWDTPAVWVELPVRIGNEISSWAFRIIESDWLKIVKGIGIGLDLAREHIKAKEEVRRRNSTETEPPKVNLKKRAGHQIDIKLRNQQIEDYFNTYPIGSKVWVWNWRDWNEATVTAHHHHARGYSASIEVLTTDNKTLYILWGNRVSLKIREG